MTLLALLRVSFVSNMSKISFLHGGTAGLEPVLAVGLDTLIPEPAIIYTFIYMSISQDI